ncbi:MAG: peptidoglycan DD-metalloendopeptidase family protein [Sphingomonadaceae bacterium]|nr:peptidoglycan DD-metalloendopeptidase family protein [Sphingomonadaceae bacterium]
MRARYITAALLCAFIGAPALPQSLPPPNPANPPPSRQSLDSNAINPATGGLSFVLGEVSTGGAVGEALSFAMEWAGSVQRDSTYGWIQNDPPNVFYEVSVGTRNERFEYGPGGFNPTTRTGSTLTLSNNVYTYTTTDGIVSRFSAILDSDYPEDDIVARITSSTRPDGFITTYHYVEDSVSTSQGPLTAERVQSITNNLGYQMHMRYAANDLTVSISDPNVGVRSVRDFNRVVEATAINNAVDYCNPTAFQCSNLTEEWPHYTFSYTDNQTTNKPVSITATDSIDRATRINLNVDGQITFISRPEANDQDIVLTYGDGRVVSFNDGVGVWSYEYEADSSGQISKTTIMPPAGGNVEVEINENVGLPSSQSNGAGGVMQYTYGPGGLLTRTMMPEGNTIGYSYNVRGDILAITRHEKPDAGQSFISTSATYPCLSPATCNRPASTTDELGNYTHYTYDNTHGGVTSIMLPAPFASAARPETRYSYAPQYARYKNSAGVIVNATNPVWRLTRIESCATGTSCNDSENETETIITWTDGSNPTNLQPVTVRRRAGNNSIGATTRYTYDPFGNVQVVDGPLGGTDDTVHYRYNEGIQVAGIIGPDPDGSASSVQHRNAQRFTYDANGNVTQTDEGTVDGTTDAAWGLFAISRSNHAIYDSVARLVTAEVRVGGTRYSRMRYTYDAASRLTCTAVRMNLTATPPADACTPGTNGPNGARDRIARNFYDNANRVTEVHDGHGTANVAVRWRRTFTDNGQVGTIEDGNGNLTTYDYDGFDRLLRRRYPNATGGGSSSTDFDGYTYDAASNVVERRLRDNTTITFSYDNLNRPTLMNPSASGTPDVTYSYDNFGRMVGAEQPGYEIEFTYDALDRLLSEDGPLGLVESQYRSDGARTHLTHPGGRTFEMVYQIDGGIRAVHENDTAGYRLGLFLYDVENRLIEVAPQTAPGRADQELGYDPVSRLGSVINDLPGTSNDLTLGMSYNAASQIVERTRSDADYAFDEPIPGSTSYNVDGLNRYPTVDAPDTGTATLTYDARGNFLRYNAPGDDDERIYVYDALNRLVSARLAGESVAEATLFSYDPLGRLYQVTDQASGVSRRYLWDGETIIVQYAGTSGSTVQRRWVYQPGSLGAPMIQYWNGQVGESSRQYVQTDERGSVVSVTNPNGTVAAINTYDPYGWPGEDNTLQFQFTGQLWLPEAELYYMRNRMYDPELGRFVQPDPIGYAAGMNLCAYVSNDPVNLVDSLGLQDGPPIDVFGPRRRRDTVPGWMQDLVNRIIEQAQRAIDRARRRPRERADRPDPCGGRLTTGPVPSGTELATPTPGTDQGNPDFGTREGGHWGLDIANQPHAPVVAAGRGTIIRQDFSNVRGFGGQVVIDHEGGVFTQYGHLESFSSQVGRDVSAGQEIGRTAVPGVRPGAGNLGAGMSSHVHFEVRLGSAAAHSQNGNPIDPKLCLPGI